MNLGRGLRAIYDAYVMEQRDKAAREGYVRNEGLEQGLKQGRSQGEDRLNQLNLSLITDKRYNDIEKAARDKKYREQLYQEYGI